MYVYTLQERNYRVHTNSMIPCTVLILPVRFWEGSLYAEPNLGGKPDGVGKASQPSHFASSIVKSRLLKSREHLTIRRL